MARTAKKRAALDKVIPIVENLLEALKEIRDTDESESSILARHGIRADFFSRVIYTTDWEVPEKSKLDEIRDEWRETIPTRNWYEDLFSIIFGIPRNWYSCGRIPPNVDKTMPVILKKLTDRERKVIEHRVRDAMSLDEVGKSLGLSAERVRQIEQRAYRKLKWQGSKAYLLCEEGYYTDSNEIREKVLKDTFVKKRMAECEKLDKIIEAKKNRVEVLLQTEKNLSKEEAQRRVEKLNTVVTDDTEICELDFTVRTFNCLTRNGISTVGQLRKAKKKDLMAITAFGYKCFVEVQTTLERFGIAYTGE